MPEIIIIAGPNGAGKTSFARKHILTPGRDFEFINADEFARQIPTAGLSQTKRDLLAARQMLEALDAASGKRKNLIVETTLAALSYVDKIRDWRTLGYRVTLIYLRLRSAEYALERVSRRVAAGGHAIPEETVRRRFRLGAENLEKYYKAVVDAWYIVDSFEGTYVLSEQSKGPE